MIAHEASTSILDDHGRFRYPFVDAVFSGRGAVLGEVDVSLEELLRRVAKKDRAAFRALYAATSSRLFAICMRLLRDRARAEEALQESFTRIWERASSFNAEKGAALAWMTVVTRRIALNDLRRRDNSHGSLDDEAAPEIAADLPQEDPMAKARLLDCLDKLGAERRQWVILAYIHGYSHEELARWYQRPLGTMKSALFRGLADLRRCIA
jgi:RNA polymerase sigma-70 factor (ECF subfamily)